MDNFDLKKFLVENKLTQNSKILNEEQEQVGITPAHIEKLAEHPKIQNFAQELVNKYPQTAEKIVNFVQNTLGVNLSKSVNESIGITQSDINNALKKLPVLSETEDNSLPEDSKNSTGIKARLEKLAWIKGLGGYVAIFLAGIVGFIPSILGLNAGYQTMGFAAMAMITVVALGHAIRSRE
jgi:hypothetical protein